MELTAQALDSLLSSEAGPTRQIEWEALASLFIEAFDVPPNPETLATMTESRLMDGQDFTLKPRRTDQNQSLVCRGRFGHKAIYCLVDIDGALIVRKAANGRELCKLFPTRLQEFDHIARHMTLTQYDKPLPALVKAVIRGMVELGKTGMEMPEDAGIPPPLPSGAPSEVTIQCGRTGTVQGLLNIERETVVYQGKIIMPAMIFFAFAANALTGRWRNEFMVVKDGVTTNQSVKAFYESYGPISTAVLKKKRLAATLTGDTASLSTGSSPSGTSYSTTDGDASLHDGTKPAPSKVKKKKGPGTPLATASGSLGDTEQTSCAVQPRASKQLEDASRNVDGPGQHETAESPEGNRLDTTLQVNVLADQVVDDEQPDQQQQQQQQEIRESPAEPAMRRANLEERLQQLEEQDYQQRYNSDLSPVTLLQPGDVLSTTSLPDETCNTQSALPVSSFHSQPVPIPSTTTHTSTVALLNHQPHSTTPTISKPETKPQEQGLPPHQQTASSSPSKPDGLLNLQVVKLKHLDIQKACVEQLDVLQKKLARDEKSLQILSGVDALMNRIDENELCEDMDVAGIAKLRGLVEQASCLRASMLAQQQQVVVMQAKLARLDKLLSIQDRLKQRNP